MRIFIAGATGVIGRQLVPMLAGHTVFGMTRSRGDAVRALGAEPVVMNIYDRERTIAAVAEARPEVVVNLLTDLASQDFAANARIRRVGAKNLVEAAVGAKARRLLVESIAFPTSADGTAAVEAMERGARESGLDATVLRLNRLFGPGTWHEERPEGTDSWLHVRDAAALFRDAIFK